MAKGNLGDGEAFRGNFSSEGVMKLRETVKEKLKDFLGDYTDDTLVEYVIVLLKNGRRKEEAKTELDVFLGDDSDPFISWLWDHLGSNLHLYVQSPGIPPAEVAKAKIAVQEPAVSVVKSASHKLEPILEKERTKDLLKTHLPKDLKGLEGDGKEHRTLKSSIVESNRAVEDRHRKVDGLKRSDSLQEGNERKRLRPEESASIKRDEIQQVAIAAPRRLLQFAVRDAVAKVRPSNLVRESSLKRLRSVVSTLAEDSPLEEQSQFVEKASKNAPAATLVEAAKDVKRIRPSRNVFDRLGRAVDVSDLPKQLTDFGVDFAGDFHGQPRNELKEEYLTCQNKIKYKEQNASGMPLSHRDTEMVFDSETKYDADARRYHSVQVPMNGDSVRNKVDDSLMFRHNVVNSADRNAQRRKIEQNQLVPDTAHKITNVNTTAGMNKWRSPHYQEMGLAVKLDNQKSELGTNSLNGSEAKNVSAIVGNGNVKSKADISKEPQRMQTSAPGLSSTGPPIEDAESRTIFVSNVHFAATKDNLSRHFNKCGEVLKVLILTDPATGLPKGSACVEFMKIEAAENALSFDGTSFMSRILKVVKKSSSSHEVVSTMTWAPAARAFPFPVPGFGAIPFPRGVPNAYRGRPFKPGGARSMQWKRDVQSIPTQMSTPATNTISPRGMTYVRSENNANGNSTGA
ncbi:hypothetical protein Leryth_008147 [Lithospermum erythrorhizon]|nr:hypothetical protein Leryth_008147 [Lithospermum erythrorhizon]